MTDVVVTVPQNRWQEWLAEGALPGELYPPDVEYYWFGGGAFPRIEPGERVYVVACGLLRGYAPLVRLETLPEAVRRWCRHEDPTIPAPSSWWWAGSRWALVRHGGAVACTIPEPVRGFRGWRYRWWNCADEHPFPGWKEKIN